MSWITVPPELSTELCEEVSAWLIVTLTPSPVPPLIDIPPPAEMLATSGAGLGYFIMVMYEVGGRIAEIISGMVLIGIIGYSMNWLLLKVEKMVMPWR